MFVQVVIDHLDEQQLIAKPRLREKAPTYTGIPTRHQTFPVDAIRSRADLLITENPVWTTRADPIQRNHGLEILSPWRFIRRYGP
jgi:hypothetical protein